MRTSPKVLRAFEEARKSAAAAAAKAAAEAKPHVAAQDKDKDGKAKPTTRTQEPRRAQKSSGSVQAKSAVRSAAVSATGHLHAASESHARASRIAAPT